MELQTLFYEVVRTFDCAILEGYRNEADQEEAFKHGFTKLHFPQGKHNATPSMAVDVAPYPVDFNDTKRLYYFAGYVMGIAMRLKEEGKMTYSIRYGGDWDRDKDLSDNKFQDLVHFELV